jgi:hypothetical protein
MRLIGSRSVDEGWTTDAGNCENHLQGANQKVGAVENNLASAEDDELDEMTFEPLNDRSICL